MLALKITCLVIISGLTCKAHRGVCPRKWFAAEFVAIADVVIPVERTTPIPDTDFTFFRNIMRLSDKEIGQVTQDAIEFFSMRFGLNFSQSIPDSDGVRTFENARLLLTIFPPEIQYTVTVNFWIFSGRTRSFCYKNRYASYEVEFTSKQMLHGTYGGKAGIAANPGEFLAYGFYSIPVSPRNPITIRFTSKTPLKFEPVDGFRIINFELHHHILGARPAQGVFKVTPTYDPGMVHYTIHNVLTFPAHPGLN